MLKIEQERDFHLESLRTKVEFAKLNLKVAKRLLANYERSLSSQVAKSRSSRLKARTSRGNQLCRRIKK